MATTVGEASIKLSFDSSTLKSSMSKAESTANSQAEKAGQSSGSSFANAWTVAAGNLIAKGVEKVVSVIENNLSSAIKRVDTMNNFPRVMSNLGISADAAADVIQDLSEKLIGLPTTLDSATSAVQRFTSKNGDVKKSEQIFLAVNDAILAGGASSEIQAAAMEQLSQAYAKGKPDMQEWRSIQTAMPAQIKQVAQAMLGNADAIEKYLVKARKYAQDNPLSSTAKELIEQLEAVKNGSGDMSTALGTALRSGVISMDEFTDTLIKMDETGVEGFASLSDQAKAATGGIETSMTNLNTAVTRAIANVINQIGSDRIQSIVNGLIQVIGNIGSAVANVVGWIIDHGELVISVIAGIGAAIATAFVAEKIVSFANTIKGAIETVQLLSLAMTGTTGLLPAIQAVITGLMGPVGIAIAIAGVVAAIATFIAMSDNGNKTISATDQLIQEVNGRLQENKTKWDEVITSQQEQISTGMSEMSYYQSLASELENIVDENGRVKDGYEERAKFITGQLSEALGIEIKMVDGVIQGYDEVKQSIDNVIASKKAKIILDSQEEAYTEAIKNQASTLEDLGRVHAELTQKKELLKVAEASLNAAIESGDQSKIKSARAWVESYQTDVDNLTATQGELSGQYQRYAFAIQQYEGNLAAYTEERYNDMDTSTWSYVSSLQDAEHAQKSTLEENASIHGSTASYLTDLWKATGNDIYKTEADNQNKLLAQDKEALSRYEAANESGLTEVEGDWSTSVGRIVATVNDASDKFKAAGTDNAHFYELGVDSKMVGAQKKGQELGDMTIKGVSNTNESMLSVGGKLGSTAIQGINDKQSDASKAGGELAKKAKTAIEDKYNEAKEAANYFAQGLGKGATAGGSSLQQAVTSLAQNAINTIKRVWKINSPSKITTAFGGFYSEGLAIGIENEAQNVLDTARQLGRDANGAIAESTTGTSINIPVTSGEIVSGSVLAQTLETDIGISANVENDGVKQPLVVDLNLDGQQIQRVFLQDIRRSTI